MAVVFDRVPKLRALTPVINGWVRLPRLCEHSG
jgi:hypothetical protein